MLLSCYFHVIAMSLPRCCHVVAMLLTCYCHVIADLSLLPCYLQRYCHVIAMLLPCYCHVIAMLLLLCRDVGIRCCVGLLSTLAEHVIAALGYGDVACAQALCDNVRHWVAFCAFGATHCRGGIAVAQLVFGRHVVQRFPRAASRFDEQTSNLLCALQTIDNEVGQATQLQRRSRGSRGLHGLQSRSALMQS